VQLEPLLQPAALLDDDHRIAADREVALARFLLRRRDEAGDRQLVAGMGQTAEREQQQRQGEPREEERSHVSRNSNRDATPPRAIIRPS